MRASLLASWVPAALAMFTPTILAAPRLSLRAGPTVSFRNLAQLYRTVCQQRSVMDDEGELAYHIAYRKQHYLKRMFSRSYPPLCVIEDWRTP
ncbi:hypothetical protein NQZ79_g7245 [Umbelopsis isabellina]|nr:hypothetical protein NQZ79_g7245 [Umbelopsis isabellina]